MSAQRSFSTRLAFGPLEDQCEFTNERDMLEAVAEVCATGWTITVTKRILPSGLGFAWKVKATDDETGYESLVYLED